jgi:DNA-binding CsgD family transcriptional regulator
MKHRFQPYPQQTHNFDRHKEFSEQLLRIERHFAPYLRSDRKQVYLEGAPHHSLGVNRLLSNYYRLTPAQRSQLASAPQHHTTDDFAYRLPMPPDTVATHMSTLFETTHSRHDTILSAADLLAQHHLMPIGTAEFRLGSPNISILRNPESPGWVCPVGAIDSFRYNTETHRLTVVELKTCHKTKKPRSLAELFLRQKFCLQLTMYALLLRLMAEEAGCPLAVRDIDLLLVGHDSANNRIAAWRLNYDPELLLGGRWQSEFWHAIFTPQRFAVQYSAARRCVIPGCERPASLVRSSQPDVTFCGEECARKLCCICHAVPQHYSNSEKRYYCEKCVRARRGLSI